MGVYYYPTLNEKEMPGYVWYYDLVQIGYHRDDWSSLQNEGDGEGVYQFEKKLGPAL